MSLWDRSFDVERCGEVRRVCAGADRASAWRSLVVAIAPHVERWARQSPLLRHCGLTGEDEARWVLVEALERLSRHDHENLRAFVQRQRPVELPRARDPLDTLGEVLEKETAAELDGEIGATPFRGWLYGLVRFAIRDHIRKRLGPPQAAGAPTRRGLGTDAERFATGEEPAAGRPPVTDWLSVRRTVEAVDAHIARMPLQMQTALRLWLDDASFEEIAREAGFPDPDRARASVRAGVARLRERFRDAPGLAP